MGDVQRPLFVLNRPCPPGRCADQLNRCRSNWGNWSYAAGVGCDPREDRYFSIPKQGMNYDPEAKFIKTWLP